MFPNILTGVIDNTIFNKIKEEIYDQQYRFNLKPALVYNTLTNHMESCPFIRRGLKMTFINNYIMNLVTNELKYLFKNNNFHYEVIGHQDLLQYKKGDEFKFHKDMKKEFSENTEIYSLIIGLKKCAFGGRTIIKINNKNNYYNESTIPGGLLMFKSLLVHKGEKVKCKTKEVLVLTVRATKKLIKYKNTSKQLSNFILCKKYISYICKELPIIITNLINKYLDLHIFIDKKITNTLFKCIKMKYTIPIQLSVHHSLYEIENDFYSTTNKNNTLNSIYITLFNGLKYRYVKFHYQKIISNQICDSFSNEIKNNNNSLLSNLFKLNNIQYYNKIQNNIKLNKKIKNDIAFYIQPFNISNIQSTVDNIILRWFNNLDYSKLINTDFEKINTHTYKEHIMCNGGDDYDVEERTEYLISGLAIYYGFIII